jgi:hypothetical protein
MILGAISSAYNQVQLHTAQINELKKKYNFYAEIKWSKVSQSKLHFYAELIDYFFATDLKFRAVGIEKAKISNSVFGETYDDFYYKLYYQLINHKIDSRYSYNVYLDIKDTLSACKVRKLREMLNTKYGVFRNVQNIRSHESVLMQFADFLTGAISYYKNDTEKKNQAKVQLTERIIEKSSYQVKLINYSEKVEPVLY